MSSPCKVARVLTCVLIDNYGWTRVGCHGSKEEGPLRLYKRENGLDKRGERGRPPIYPYLSWMNGQWWRIEHGVDFQIGPDDMAGSLRQHVRRLDQMVLLQVRAPYVIFRVIPNCAWFPTNTVRGQGVAQAMWEAVPPPAEWDVAWRGRGKL